MAHQDDVASGVASGLAGDAGPQAVAMPALRQSLHRQPVTFQETPDHRAHGIDPRLVVATAVDVHHLPQHGDHGVMLRGQPAGDFGFGHPSRLLGLWCPRV